MDTLTHDDIRTAVRARYGTIAGNPWRGAAYPGLLLCGVPPPTRTAHSWRGGTATATLDMKAQA